MENILNWIVEHPEVAAPIVGVVLDIVMGAIPDKWLKYKGIARRFLRGLLNRLEEDKK